MRRPVFSLLLLLAMPALAPAAERPLPRLNFDTTKPEPPYEGLPGVKTPEQLAAEKEDGFTCTTVLSTRRNPDPRGGFSRTLPERVYRCEKGGMVVEGPNPPARGAWMPGINPPDARR